MSREASATARRRSWCRRRDRPGSKIGDDRDVLPERLLAAILEREGAAEAECVKHELLQEVGAPADVEIENLEVIRVGGIGVRIASIGANNGKSCAAAKSISALSWMKLLLAPSPETIFPLCSSSSTDRWGQSKLIERPAGSGTVKGNSGLVLLMGTGIKSIGAG